MPDDIAPADHLIRSEADLRLYFGHAEGLAVQKSLSRLDRYCRMYISRSPFLCIGTTGADGRADVSPRGDRPGFVQILDDQTLAIPDRPGNNRLDTMVNIIANPSVGLLFLVPGFDDTLRVNGKAAISRDPALLAAAAVDGKLPKVVIRLAVEEAFLHCAKAFKRSRLWDPAAHADRSALPSIARMILEQAAGREAVDEAEAAAADVMVEQDYRNELY
jgi:PPOX class probable FMN-dependent enzyme